MVNRIYLRKLQSIGNNRPVAEIDFKKGLNVVSGASNTGKSYIIECVDYLFGAQTPPRDINESHGYEYLLLEFETTKGDIFTIKRFFKETKKSKILLYRSQINNIIQNTPRELGRTANSNDSLSDFLLSILELKDKKLLSSVKTGKTIEISFRILNGFLIIDENRIIDKKSPVYKDNYQKATYKSAFNLLLSGKDDAIIKEVENPEIYKSKLNAKIDILGDWITKISNEIKELENNSHTNAPQEKIDFIKNQIQSNTELINLKTLERNNYFNVKEELNDKRISQERLLLRYALLKEHYENDLRRLNFVEEGGYYLNQLNDFPCPVCQSKTIPSREDFDQIIKSCNEESNKTLLKINDLNITISNTESSLDETKEKLSINQADISTIEKKLNEELKPVVEMLEEKLNEIIELQKNINKKENYKKQIEEYSNEKNKLQRLLANYKESNISNDISFDYYKNFEKEVSNTLSKWKYKENSVISFSEKDLDITINGEPRINQGKGHRAITYAAFIISLLKYTINQNLVMV